MRIAFARWRSGGLFNRPSPRKRLLPKKKTSSRFEFVSGLAAGASAMPAKWSRPVFSFGFYEGKISRALIVIRRLPTIATTARPRVSAAGLYVFAGQRGQQRRKSSEQSGPRHLFALPRPKRRERPGRVPGLGRIEVESRL